MAGDLNKRMTLEGASSRPYLPLQISNLVTNNVQMEKLEQVNWQGLFANSGHESDLTLNIARSETVQDITINRRWDIDSIIASPKCLSIHKGGFEFAFRPPFLSHLTQNQKVKFGNLEFHRIKGLRIGKGLAAGGFGYNCWVCFPNQPVGKFTDTHLSYQAQEVWIDHIILPALRRVCSKDFIQHYPQSFKDAELKAEVKKELYGTSQAIGMDLRYYIHAQYLQPFWTEVKRLAASHNAEGSIPSNAFANPMLVIMGHNLKLTFKQETLLQTVDEFIEHFRNVFDINDTTISTKDIWIDLGIEDCPQAEGYTLLRKTPCLEHWQQQFTNPTGKNNAIRTTIYPWHLTRDAAAAEVELLVTNALRHKGIAFNKAYNSIKELFHTPLKGYSPFNFEKLEGLAYSEDLLNRWLELKDKRTGKTQQQHHSADVNIRKRLLAQYLRTKARVANAMRYTHASFGVRQEYRVYMDLLHQIQTHEQMTEDESENITLGSDQQSVSKHGNLSVFTYLSYRLNSS